jgi:hypothetical protein
LKNHNSFPFADQLEERGTIMAFSDNTTAIRSGLSATKKGFNAWRERRKEHDMWGRTERFCWTWSLALLAWAITRFILHDRFSYMLSALWMGVGVAVLAAVCYLQQQYQLDYYLRGAVGLVLLTQWVVYVTYYGHLPHDPVVADNQMHIHWPVDYVWTGYFTPLLVAIVAVSLWWSWKQPLWRRAPATSNNPT